jgi:L-arabinokinase
VRAASAFPVHENARVRAALAADLSASALGRLLDASHQGYSACGLGAAATDAIAALVRAAVGLGGARISGGGCGGTVIVAGEAGNDALVERIAREHERRSGLRARVFRGTSPGACQVPVRVL